MESNGKFRSDSGKPASIGRVAGAVLVLLAAVGVGLAVREYRFLAAGEKRAAEVPEVVRVVEAPVIIDLAEPVFVEEVVEEPEAVEAEPVSPPAEAVEAGDAAMQAEPAGGPVVEEEYDEAKIKERRGREALALIGYDPAADAVWIEVINDPSVSANARSNLIEDLNEDGFPDKNNPTRDDLPMIEYRIGLIEELRPYAMDKTNADAFDEAHKDLVNMVNRLTRP